MITDKNITFTRTACACGTRGVYKIKCVICICIALAVTVTALIFKVLLLKRAFGEIDDQVKDHLDGTNSSVFQLSTSDKNARKLANDLNGALQELHEERVFLKDGDKRMKENVTAISHDLRTPLTAINSYVDLLESENDEAKRKHNREQPYLFL